MKLKVKKSKLILFIINTLLLSVFAIAYHNVSSNLDSEYNAGHIYMLSVFGLLLLIYVIVSTRFLRGNVLNYYNAFVIFYSLFNFGQCLLWVFNIHTSGELGSTSLLTMPGPTIATIIRTQLVFVVSLLGIHEGAIIGVKKRVASDTQGEALSKGNKKYLRACIVVCVISGIATFVNIMHSIMVARNYGYRSLYYGDYANSGNTFVILISKMFIPSLIGILVYSGFDKWHKRIVYALFAMFIIGWLLCGDRGAWIYALAMFIILHYSFCKRINYRRMILYSVIALLLLTVVNGVVKTRNAGISFETISSNVDFGENALSRGIFEMGSTMTVNAIMLQHGDNIDYPYGDTFLNTSLSFVSEKPMYLLNSEYKNATTWFSSDYLKINYGAGFSFIAEILINYNVYMVPVFSAVLGLLLSRLFLRKHCPDSDSILLESISFLCVVYLCRGQAQDAMKLFFYSYLVFILIIRVLANRKLFLRRNCCKKEEIDECFN